MRLLVLLAALVLLAFLIAPSSAEGSHRPIPYPIDEHIGVGNQGMRGQQDMTHPALPSAEGVNIRYKLVSVVYFYPRDEDPHLEYVAQVDPTVDQMKGWYGALVGSTFEAQRVRTVRGAGTLAQYQDNFWGDILRELGYYCGTGVHLIVIHDAIAPGYGGGGSCQGDGGGTAMVSERWLGSGAVPHEMGHAFTLPHPNCVIYDCSATVMWEWWRYPNVGLLDYEIQTLQSHSSFGSGSDDPTACKPFKGKGKALGRCR